MSAAGVHDRVTVETVTGESLQKEGLRSLADGQVLFADGSSSALDDLRFVRFGDAAGEPRPAPMPLVHLAGGGRLPVQSAVLLDDAC
jgi:hypothetical protein